MISFDSEIAKFSNNYMVVPGHVDDAVDRLQKIWEDATSVFESQIIIAILQYHCTC